MSHAISSLSIAKRIALSFAAMVAMAMVCIFLLWYYGLPQWGVAGAIDQKLMHAARILEQTAGHRRDIIKTLLQERRGAVRVIAENLLITRKLAEPSSDIQADVLRVFERTQRAYPDAIKQLRIVDAASPVIRGSSRSDEVGSVLRATDLLARASQPGILEVVEETRDDDVSLVVIARQMSTVMPDGNHRLLAIALVYLDAAQLAASATRNERDGVALTEASLVFGSEGQVLARFGVPEGADNLFRRDDRLSMGVEDTQLMETGHGGEILAVFRHVPLGAGRGWTLVHYQSKDEALQGLSESVRAVALIALLLSGLAVVVIAVAARQLTLPLKRLADSATAFGEGDLGARAPAQPSASQEVLELSHAFNAMAERVEKNQLLLEAQVQERTMALVRQRDTAQRYLDIARVMLIALDSRGYITLVNRKAEEVLGYTEQDLLGLDWIDNFLPSTERSASRASFESLMAGSSEGREYFENRIMSADGQVRVVAWNNTILRDDHGKPIGTLSSGEDITERQRAEGRLKLAASVFTHAREGITITDARGAIIEVNDTFTRVTGYSREEAIGQTPRMLQSGRHGADFYAQMWAELGGKGHWSGEVWNRHKNGEVYAELLTISAVRNAAGKTQNYVALFTDITPMKDHQRQLERIAHFDALTSLPNRVLLADRLNQGLAQSQRRQKGLAVAFLDLDGFKAVNDTHGHDVGDHLLVALAQRMKAALREGDTLARIGGDEFVAVLVDLGEPGACEPVLHRLLQAAAEPVTVGDAELQVSASVGVTLYPQDGSDADLLMRHADQAMYQAKQAGKNRYHLFDVAHDVASKSLRQSLDEIHLALQRSEFVLYYQPKVNMRTGQVVGAEALIRWQHPERGLLPPGLFLPAIEGHPVSTDIGEWVIASALTQMGQWHAQGLDVPVSVNIGAHQLQQGSFMERLTALLAGHPQLPGYSLELEILETSALEDISQVSDVMAACQALGVGFALDDFGTGYSSLTYLKRLPAQLLKIDQSFVRDMQTDADDLAIVQGVIGLAKAFGRHVIAEGVETVELGAVLLGMGCDLAQGYGIARPMPADEIPAWVAAWRPDPRWDEVV